MVIQSFLKLHSVIHKDCKPIFIILQRVSFIRIADIISNIVWSISKNDKTSIVIITVERRIVLFFMEIQFKWINAVHNGINRLGIYFIHIIMLIVGY